MTDSSAMRGGELDFEGGRPGRVPVLRDHDRRAGSIVGDPPAGEQGVAGATAEAPRLRAVAAGAGDRLPDAPGLDAVQRQQVVEGGAFDVGPADVGAE